MKYDIYAEIPCKSVQVISKNFFCKDWIKNCEDWKKELIGQKYILDTILPRHLLYIVLVFIEKPLHIVSKLVNVLYIKNEGRITFAILYPISIKVEATEGHLYCCCPVLGRVVAGVSVLGSPDQLRDWWHISARLGPSTCNFHNNFVTRPPGPSQEIYF